MQINPLVLNTVLSFVLSYTRGTELNLVDALVETVTDGLATIQDRYKQAETLAERFEVIKAIPGIFKAEAYQEWEENVLKRLASDDDKSTPTLEPEVLDKARVLIAAKAPTGAISAQLEALKARLNPKGE